MTTFHSSNRKLLTGPGSAVNHEVLSSPAGPHQSHVLSGSPLATAIHQCSQEEGPRKEALEESWGHLSKEV